MGSRDEISDFDAIERFFVNDQKRSNDYCRKRYELKDIKYFKNFSERVYNFNDYFDCHSMIAVLNTDPGIQYVQSSERRLPPTTTEVK